MSLNLRPSEKKALNELIRCGTSEIAAAYLGICHKTIDHQLGMARDRNNFYRTIQLAVAFALEQAGVNQEQK